MNGRPLFPEQEVYLFLENEIITVKANISMIWLFEGKKWLFLSGFDRN